MDENENEARDTMFQGFAKLVFDDLLQAKEQLYPNAHDYLLSEEEKQHYQQVIAQHSYDLVKHTLIQLDLQEHMCDIPDLTK